MKRVCDLSRGKLLAIGAILAAFLLSAVIWWQATTPRHGQLPTSAELQEPFAKPGPGGAAGLLSEEQGQALQEGKTVTVNVPGGGTFVLSPSEKASSEAAPDPKK